MNLQAKPSFEPKTQNQFIQDNFNEFLKQETFKPMKLQSETLKFIESTYL